MRIAFVCTQPPGYGGAATSSYEAIKHLRALGADVTGYFIDHCGREGCDHGKGLAFDPLSDWHDPEGIGGIVKLARCEAGKRGALDGDYDIAVGKNYGAAILMRLRQDIPTVYLTSGLGFLSKIDEPYTEIDRPFPDNSPDIHALKAVSHVIVHSSLILDYYRRHLPPDLLAKVVGGVVPTPDMAVPANLPEPIPYLDRRFDVALLSSSWKRPVKNGRLAKYVSLRVGATGGRVVAIGNEWGMPSSHETAMGLVSHEVALMAVAGSRVVVIPSLLDASPGVYTEAIALGCNVVASPNIGNTWGHPAETFAPSVEMGPFAATVLRACKLDRQMGYREINPPAVARQLLERLGDIVRRGR